MLIRIGHFKNIMGSKQYVSVRSFSNNIKYYKGYFEDMPAYLFEQPVFKLLPQAVADPQDEKTIIPETIFWVKSTKKLEVARVQCEKGLI